MENILLDDSFERKTKILDENADINENIIIDKNDFPQKTSCIKKVCFSLFPYCKKVNTVNKKFIYIKDRYKNNTEWSNKMENHKYNLITFIPIVLFNQFKQFGNFFLFIIIHKSIL